MTSLNISLLIHYKILMISNYEQGNKNNTKIQSPTIIVNNYLLYASKIEI